MKEFGVTECLTNDGLHKFAIFIDSSMESTEIYNIDEYLYVDNKSNPDNPYLPRNFTGRIKDAVDTIRKGEGDCILQSRTMFDIQDYVVYFINRSIGDKFRQKFIEGWKDSTFGWIIQYGHKHSFHSQFRPINTQCQQLSMVDGKPPMVFNTYSHAESYVKSLINKAGEYAKKYADELKGITDYTIRDMILDNTLDAIATYAGVRYSVIEDFLFDMFTGDMELKSEECNLDELTYEIIQYAIEE